MQPASPPGGGAEPLPWPLYPRALRYVAAGGVVGAVARWGAVDAVDPMWASHTLAGMNVLGSILLGVLIGLYRTRAGHRRLTTNQFLLLGTGFSAALTSFPGYAVEVATALDTGDLPRAAAIGLGTAGASVIGGGLGYRLGSRP